MHKIIFKTTFSSISKIEEFCENENIQNFCVFESQEREISKIHDMEGIPFSEIFNVDIFTKSKKESEIIKKKLQIEFKENIFDIKVEELNDCDWVDLYIKNQTPTTIENLLFYNPNCFTPIKISSSLAFGNGDHQTTKGCILMLFYLARYGFRPKSILDMGCGTGILSISASKIWDCIKDITAVDIDEDAVQITKNNFIDNGINGNVLHGSDLSCLPGVRCVDLVLCNIFKRQLEGFSKEFFKILKRAGMIVISGFIKKQYEEIDSHYLKIGFRRVHSIGIDEWLTVLYKTP
ncbi:MAG: 50S ribosomal protein L11 methyltransferase [Holosporales bacterium]|nr:50S ribosomal protein L11 methyltransferase [Holosporales bacterium]